MIPFLPYFIQIFNMRAARVKKSGDRNEKEKKIAKKNAICFKKKEQESENFRGAF